MRLLTILLILLISAPAAAQEQRIRQADLPRALELRLLRMYDDGRRISGDESIEHDQVVEGDLAATDGLLRVAGRVEGDVAMVDGDVIVETGGHVTGSVIVVGGEVRLDDGGRVDGTITSYGGYADRAGERNNRERPEEDRDADVDWDWDDGDDRDRDRGSARLTLRTGASYNRVEGLPLMFGPVLRTEGPNPLRLEALAIWRSESGGSLETERMGYRARLEQFLGGERQFSIGASVYSVIDPIEEWQVGDLETSLATLLFHEDFRDYFDRTGWSAFARAEPVPAVEALLEFRSEKHEAVGAGDPWSLFDGDDLWRPQPLVAEGDVQSLVGTLEVDLRDREDEPRRGWYARLSLQRPLGGELVRPALLAVGARDETPPVPVPSFLPPEPQDLDFTTGQIDLRRYTAVGRRSQLNLRVVAGGSLTGEALPSQFQHALGGIGTLPGFDHFTADCGARAMLGSYEESTFFPAYGCDRFAIGQVEFRGDLSLDFGFGDDWDNTWDQDWDDEDDWWDEVDFDFSPTWVVFFDAGRGWAHRDELLGGDRDTGALYDAGVGFLLDDVGLYAALPLNDEVDQEPRFFIRLSRRF